MKTERVVLIGLRCSGKTSVGKLVAEKLARRGGPGSLRPAPPAPDNAPGSLRPAPPAPDNAPGRKRGLKGFLVRKDGHVFAFVYPPEHEGVALAALSRCPTLDPVEVLALACYLGHDPHALGLDELA